ncbi:MAG: hypothetical protein Q4F31_06315 [Eubacteriales bacterium]|nr:hypothetical protein [Eubacteriales bacterium]
MKSLFRKSSPTAVWIHHKPVLQQDYYECSRCHREYSREYPVCPGCSAEISGTQSIPDYIDDMEMIEEILGK